MSEPAGTAPSFLAKAPPLGEQVALVTGANSGMGLATTRALLEAGYRVAATDLRTEHVAQELAAYGGGLVDKPEIIGLNKSDDMSPREASARRAALAKASGRPVMLLSGAGGDGVPDVLRALQNAIHTQRRDAER